MTEADASFPASAAGRGAPGDALLLPPPTPHSASDQYVNARPAGAMKALRMTPILVVTILSAALALSLAGWQITRAMNGDERLGSLNVIEITSGIVATLGVLAWTWVVVENARRLIATGLTTDLPSPRAAATSWAMPLVVAAASVGAVAFLERRINTVDAETTSPIPLATACIALIVTLCVSYRPLFLLSATIRRLGGGVGDLARWVWVPIALVVVGALTLFGLRAGGSYGDDFEGIAPAWALGVVFIPPVAIVLALAWRGGRVVEDAVHFAYDRRNGVHVTGVGRRDLGMFARALRADARPPIARDMRARIRLLPGAAIVRLAMTIATAGLTLISIVGALVMFLFWREASDGALLPAQRERAWNSLSGLQDLERMVAAGALAVTVIWSFVTVLNARIASGRRRNPILAAAAWPAAAYAMWEIAQRFSDTEEIEPLVTRFGLQAAVLYVPFFLLERAAVAVGARRGPLRLSYAMGVVMLVHIQGLGGLATLAVEADVDRFGRIAGYLALAALLELVTTLSVTEVSRLIGDASVAVAGTHNFLADQRSQIDARAAAVAATHQTVPTVPVGAGLAQAPVPTHPTPSVLQAPAAAAPAPDSVAAPAPQPAPSPQPAPAPQTAPPPPPSSAQPGSGFDPGQPLSSIPPLVYRPATSPTGVTIAASSPPDPPPGS